MRHPWLAMGLEPKYASDRLNAEQEEPSGTSQQMKTLLSLPHCFYHFLPNNQMNC